MEMRNISVHRDQSRSFAGGRRRGGNAGTPSRMSVAKDESHVGRSAGLHLRNARACFVRVTDLQTCGPRHSSYAPKCLPTNHVGIT